MYICIHRERERDSRRIFHLPMRPKWNTLDSIIAGDLQMPAALPYPVVSSSSNPDRCEVTDGIGSPDLVFLICFS